MGKDKENKKSLWNMFFGVLDDEEDKDVYPEEDYEDDEDDNLASVLEGKDKKKSKKSKKIVPVFEDSKELSFGNDDDRGNEEGKGDDVKEEAEEGIKGEDNKESFSAEELDRRFIAPAEHYFFVHNGPTLKDLYDLEYYLGTITEDQLRHHVKEDDNDFANWVRGVFKEENLAAELERAKDRDTMCSILSSFLNSR
ncbi:MAG: hypothetical protein ACQESA_00725 [Patescibacteria group bacterium]